MLLLLKYFEFILLLLRYFDFGLLLFKYIIGENIHFVPFLPDISLGASTGREGGCQPVTTTLSTTTSK